MGKSSAGRGALNDPDWGEYCGDRWRAHVLATTGADISEVSGSSSRRPRDWVAMMRRVTVQDMNSVMSAVHGDAIPYRQARRGDMSDVGWAIGICHGDRAEFYGDIRVPTNAPDQVLSLQAALDRPLNSTARYTPDF